MKKILIFLTLILAFGLFTQSQTVLTIANYGDTITDDATAYYYVGSTTVAATSTVTVTSSNVIKGKWQWSSQVYVDHITGSTDSTHINWEGSIDGITWHNINTLTAASGTYTQTISITQATNESYPGAIKVSFSTTDDQFLWYPATLTQFKYMRMKVQHFATGTIRIKAYMLLK